MKKFLVACLSLVSTFVWSPVMADNDGGVDVGSSDDSFFANLVIEEYAQPNRDVANVGENDGPRIVLGQAACEGANSVALPRDSARFCEGADPEPTLTAGMVRRAFEEWRLPAGELVIEPPGGATLVNFDTNFFTTSTESLQRTVTLLGQQVTLEATPDVYTWSFGDGEALTTSDPGAAYPALRVTHRYLKVDTYRPSLGTTYVGRFRVGGGPWRQIPGTVTVDGAGQDLRAVEATPKLVGQ